MAMNRGKFIKALIASLAVTSIIPFKLTDNRKWKKGTISWTEKLDEGWEFREVEVLYILLEDGKTVRTKEKYNIDISKAIGGLVYFQEGN